MAEKANSTTSRPSGFGTTPEYNYGTFLSEMGLRDTPDAKDTFRQYQNRMAAQGPQTNPRLFTPGMDTAPARPSTPTARTC
jgi:hypothetical protein